MKTGKKANATLIMLSIVLIIAVVCFAVISFAWYSVSVDDVTADLNVETNSVYTFEVLHASFFTPNDVLTASVANPNNQYPANDAEAEAGNIAKLKYATLDVDYKIYNSTNAENYVFNVIGLEVYAPGIVSEYDEPMYKVDITKDADGNKILTKSEDGIIIRSVISDLEFCFSEEKDENKHAVLPADAVWKNLTDIEGNYSLSRDGTLYLAVRFNKYDDLLDEAIYNGIQIKVLVSMEKAV